MPRISIFGCSGAGKSTLARALGKKLALPVFHIDQLYWTLGWKPRDTRGFRSRMRFNRDSMPPILAAIEKYGSHLTIIKLQSNQAIADFLARPNSRIGTARLPLPRDMI